MSLKGIELQIAIPKTFDAGKIAEQKHQQTQLNLDHANSLMERQALKGKETVWNRKRQRRRMRMDIDRNKVKDAKRRPQQNEEEKKTVHPYKGAFVDFTG